jgi:ABC-type amino acid transport substrate-binding protein
MVLSGEAWATFPYGYSVEMGRSYDFSDPIFTSRHKFYFLKSNEKLREEAMDFSRISEFPNSFTFGGANGYWYGNQAEVEKSGLKTEWANDTDALIKMLRSERIDFFIEDDLVCDEAIQRLFPKEIDKFAKLPNEAKIQDYYLIVSKDYRSTNELTEKFNEALYILRENGQINKILEDNGIE